MLRENHQTIFLSAAEPSGDRHAAGVVRQLAKELPQFRCHGLGGPAMADAGCNLLCDLTNHSAMLGHALGQVGFYFRLLQRVKAWLSENRPELVVVIDSPAWNFHVAKAAKQLGIPVLYYVAPQLWAWGAWRLGKLRKRADRVACILPFEEKWFASRRVPARFVGHPLFDDGPNIPAMSPWSALESKTFPTIALLPGSRRHEIAHLWGPMQEIARAIQDKYPNARFHTAAASDELADILRAQANPVLGIEIRRTTVEAVTRRADLTLVASGTATLEVAAQNCPMLVMYHVNRWQWHLLGRLLIRTPHICLVNILAGKELVPEFVPFQGQMHKIKATAMDYLENNQKRQDLRLAIRELVAPIIKPGAAVNVVRIIKEMLPLY